MEIRTREEEREYLLKLIFEWNASRLDIFEISQPDEDLEYKGVMRFFFQDSGTKNTKVATKCVRVSSKDTTDDVLKVLVEKFRPDMKMLTNPEYQLYEVHPNGEARQLTKIEHPLKVQLEWQKDDREGRFLLKSSKDKVAHSSLFAASGGTTNTNQNFKRRLSKREKKELKKKQQEEAKKVKSNDDTAIAQNLYDELPETSFTRSISNPEAVMRRRRQQKLEKRLKEFQEKEGSDSGGTLKIFAETLKPEIPYKTLLVGMRDTAAFVVKESLDKYQMKKEEPEDYCLVMVNVPEGGQTGTGVLGKERVVHDDDCPLAIATTWPSNRGTIVFHLRRRANLPRYRKEKRTRSKSPARVPLELPADKTAAERLAQPSSVPQHLLPYLAELSPDGYEMDHQPQILRLQMNLTEIGSEKSPSPKANHILLRGPNILHRHCVITNNDGRISITPSSSDAEIYINNKRIKEMTDVRHGNVVRLGKLLLFRFYDPVFENNNKRHSAPGLHSAESSNISSISVEEKSRSNHSYVPNRHSEPIFPIHDQTSISSGLGSSMSQSTLKDHSSVSTIDEDMDADPGTMYETTFDVDGDIKTITSSGARTSDSELQPSYGSALNLLPGARPAYEVQHDDVDESLLDKLPATLEFQESGEDAFFAAVISEVNGAAVQFKLAPTYTLYMCCRYRISPWYKRELPPQQRYERLGVTLLKIANMVRSTVRENNQMPSSLAFWMANASELLHFLKADRDTAAYSKDGQQILAQSIQLAFRHLVHCIQYELRLSMPAFLDETDEADQEDSDMESMMDSGGVEAMMGSERSFSIQQNCFGRPLSSDNLLGSRRYNGTRPSISDVLYTLSSAMSLLRRCRVNAALTIQVFSQLFHFINMWLFNKLVLEPQLGLCSRAWGRQLLKRLSRIDSWAEKQGLDLASDCHLCRVVQAAHLLQAPKSSPKDITDISSTCFKLNSIQLRTLLENYRPAHDERLIPQELINNVAAVAENTADELMRSSGQEIHLEEDPELQLPFLLPDDGYSDEVIRGVPPGLKEFLDPLCATGLCRLNVQPKSSGLWTVYQENFKQIGNQSGPLQQTLEIIDVSFNKGRGGMGISIVAAKGANQDQLGIYIKQVVKEGPASKDGRLQAGDQILSVNGESLIGVSQEKAAECLVKAGNLVYLRVAKQGAIHHGLATLLNQPAPMISKEPPKSPITSPTLPDHEMQRSPGRWMPNGRGSGSIEENQLEERRIKERRRIEEQWQIEEERKEREEAQRKREEEERYRKESKRRRAEEERRREEEKIREEKRLMEEQRRLEEERRKEEERLRIEEEERIREEERRRDEERRRLDEIRRMEEEQQRFAAERQRAEEDQRRERERFMEEQRRLDEERRLEEERRREEQRRFAEDSRLLAEEQLRVQNERRQAEDRMRAIGEQQKQQRKKRIRFEDEDENYLTASQTNQQPPRSPNKGKPQSVETRQVDAPRNTGVPVPADLDSHEMPAYTIKFQKPPTLPVKLEPETSVRRENNLYASPNTAPFTDNRLQRETSPETLRKEKPPSSPVRLESRDTRYGRAIVVTKGMLAQPPVISQRPKVQDSERLAQQLAQQEKEQKKSQEKYRNIHENDEFERWQQQEKRKAEEKERQLSMREQMKKEELERVQQQQREIDNRIRREQEARLLQERERQDRERQEKERQERERQLIENQRQSEQNSKEEAQNYNRQKRGSTELLDKIETMSADEVEKEFQRRLDEENRRRDLQSGLSSEAPSAVTRVQYVIPEIEEQIRRKAEEERQRHSVQYNRMTQLEKEREQQRETQLREQEQRDREQKDWLQEQREKRERQRMEQDRMRAEKKMMEEEEEKRKRQEVMQKREQEEALRRSYQVQREQEQEKLLREQRNEALRREEERKRQIEQQKIVREKDEELRRQQEAKPTRLRMSNDESHINDLKAKAMTDYERRRPLLDEDNQLQRGNASRPQEQSSQRLTNSLLKNSNTNSLNKTKKQVSFSNVTTEITEPSAPSYVVGTSSGYTAIVTPAPSVRLVPSRIPDDEDPPPYNSPPRPEYDDDDLPPPPPPPPPPELLDDDIAFPAPPPAQSSTYDSNAYNERYERQIPNNGTWMTDDTRSFEHAHGNGWSHQQDVPVQHRRPEFQFQRTAPETSSQNYTSYVTWPRKNQPSSYPERQDDIPFKPRYVSQDNLDDRVSHSGSYSRAQLAPKPWRGSNENMLQDQSRNVGDRFARISLNNENKTRDMFSAKPESMKFRDKQKLFNEGTPQEKARTSRWERDQIRQVNGDVSPR